ncbi:LysR family transcriptional regulator [Streptomyces sudanensis]|uniref:LysR family transcriptional regulator n=1 Tax=Streptomyces sudanensis TaxID=436397 RepID=UPI0020CDBF52|nr:LysR family transcriptional regulator [Streptomyces sudanensis]MCP9958527.1 LysR family transcriptional regulator [Streptomyces sudanensis]MCP9987644.1 LysR family transcriptional regulator [Streptomyces sudanensis]MCQ0000962.1 LysR family transcriptional regulator [Streptomyces sudanensis]
MNVEVQDLRVLRAVADTGSLAGAARALGVSQAGVTRRIQHLERATGLVVLRRDHQGARLTAAGRLLLLCADELLPKIDRLLAAGRHEDPAATAGPPTERLRIGTVPTPVLPLVAAHARALLPRSVVEPCTLLDAYREPAADPRTAAFGAALPDLFRTHRLDLAVVRHSSVLDGPLPGPLESAVLAEEDMLIGTATDHRLAGRSSLSLADLTGELCLLVGGRRHADLRRHFTAAVRHAGVDVELRQTSDEAEAAALVCGVRGVLPAYPFPAPAVGVAYTPLSDAGTRHRLLLVWPSDGGAAAWAPGLAEAVREAYRSGGRA